MEWIVVTVIIALVGLFMTIGKPIITLNSNIVRLNCSVEELNRKQDEQAAELECQEQKAHDAHKRIWDHENKQDKQLNEHERRIGKLEGKE